MKVLRAGIALAALVLVGALSILVYRLMEDDRLSAAVQIGAPFELASARGGTVKSTDLAGAPYGLFFGFTHCPEVCPTTIYEMSALLKELGEEAKDFRLFFVTVDPERDTAEKLNGYLTSFDPRIGALVPTPAQLPELASSFRVIYEKVPTSDGSYTMNHTATVFLFDRQGHFRSSIAYGEARESREQKLRKLVAVAP